METKEDNSYLFSTYLLLGRKEENGEWIIVDKIKALNHIKAKEIFNKIDEKYLNSFFQTIIVQQETGHNWRTLR